MTCAGAHCGVKPALSGLGHCRGISGREAEDIVESQRAQGGEVGLDWMYVGGRTTFIVLLRHTLSADTLLELYVVGACAQCGM